MDKEKRKSLILITLIVLCIWQTGKLWLGNLSSLNFFPKLEETVFNQIEPMSIWLSPGAPVTLIYRLGEENREYQSVINEIGRSISTYMNKAKSQGAEPLDWNNILTKKGILYEYPISLTYTEVIGDDTLNPPANFPKGEEIDYIFIQLTEEKKNIMKWYLIDSKNNVAYPLEVEGQFGNMKNFNDLLRDESFATKVKYQPTFNVSGISNKNIFLPISSKELPLVYDILEYYNPLDNYNEGEEFSRFNPYVNHFFLNPLLKKEEKTEDGVYIFSELMRAVVKYYPNGMFEYSNIGVSPIRRRGSRLSSYNIAKEFLNKSESIPKEAKKRLFLSDIIETETGYIFCFDMRIKGIPIYLSQRTREKLNMDHIVEVRVQGSQVANFRWSAYALRTKIYAGKPVTDNFTVKYTEGLNQVLEYIAQQTETNTLAIDDMKWVYMINPDENDIHVRWIVLHENRWYAP